MLMLEDNHFLFSDIRYVSIFIVLHKKSKGFKTIKLSLWTLVYYVIIC